MFSYLTSDIRGAFHYCFKKRPWELIPRQYGEQWGRNWLDVVRYADTAGYSNDFERPNAWRYRDYVIRSFNADKPYNRFVIEQLAGDEFEPNNPEMLIAVGYLRSGPWEQTGMSVAAETRQLFLDDVTNSVGETFLSIPLRCARCHDHKFDPIPTRDYYRMQAVFAPVQFAERDVPYLSAENQNRFETGRLRIESLLQNAIDKQAEIRKKEEDAMRKWMEERGMEYLSRRERSKLPDDKRLPRFIGLTHKDLGTQKVLAKQVQRLRWKKDRYKPMQIWNPLRGIPFPKQRMGDDWRSQTGLRTQTIRWRHVRLSIASGNGISGVALLATAITLA